VLPLIAWQILDGECYPLPRSLGADTIVRPLMEGDERLIQNIGGAATTATEDEPERLEPLEAPLPMTDLTELQKVAIRCSQCQRYRAHTDYKEPLGPYDELRKPVCDPCRRGDDAEKSVIRREPIRIDIELTKVAKLRAASTRSPRASHRRW